MEKVDSALLWHVLMQGSRCLVCGEALFVDVPYPKNGSPTWEHKLPKVHGGKNGHANLGVSHHECNRSRNNRMSMRRLRPEKPGPQKQGRKWRAQFVTQSPACGLWWTQRSIRTLNNRQSRHSANGDSK